MSTQQQQQTTNQYGQTPEQQAAMRTAMDPTAGYTYCPHITIGVGCVLIIPGIIFSIMLAMNRWFGAGPVGPFCLILGVFLLLTGAMCIYQRRRVLAAQQAGIPLGQYGWGWGRSGMQGPVQGPPPMQYGYPGPAGQAPFPENYGPTYPQAPGYPQCGGYPQGGAYPQGGVCPQGGAYPTDSGFFPPSQPAVNQGYRTDYPPSYDSVKNG